VGAGGNAGRSNWEQATVKKSWVDGGRIETVVAGVVLAAVLGLFVKFYRTDDGGPTAPSVALQAPANTGPSQH
jgi:hypothetical protein